MIIVSTVASTILISEAWDEATMPIPSPMDIGVALIRSKYVPGEWLSEYYTLCGQGNP